MNKEYIKKLVDSLNLKQGEYYIVGSAAMVLRGLREKARDLDLCLSFEAFENIKSQMKVTKSEHISNLYRINEEIEFFVDPKASFRIEYVDGYPLEDINVLLEYKLKRNKEKDKEDVKKILEYIKNK